MLYSSLFSLSFDLFQRHYSLHKAAIPSIQNRDIFVHIWDMPGGLFHAYPVACQNGVLRMSLMRVPLCWDRADSKVFTFGTKPDRHGLIFASRSLTI